MISTDRQNRPLFQCSLQSFRGMRIPFRCQLWTGRVCPLLRFISREMVDGLTFIALAMSFFFVPFWSKIKIVYLCSEVNCLLGCPIWCTFIYRRHGDSPCPCKDCMPRVAASPMFVKYAGTRDKWQVSVLILEGEFKLPVFLPLISQVQWPVPCTTLRGLDADANV